MTDLVWKPLVAGLLEAVWIVDRGSLRILAANAAALKLCGRTEHDLVGSLITGLTGSPEDHFFWHDVSAGRADAICSLTRLAHADGSVVHVERSVNPLLLAGQHAVFLVSMLDRSQQQRAEDELEKLMAEIRATLDSASDGILVCGPNGAIRAFNQRFSKIWSVPDELLLQRDDEAVGLHLAAQVVDADGYRHRMAQIMADPLCQTNDLLLLASGRTVEQVTVPQLSRGRPIGLVFSFRDVTDALHAQAGIRLAAKVFESSLDAIFIVGPDFRIMAANRQCSALAGPLRANIGEAVMGLFENPDQDDLLTRVQCDWQRDGYWSGELWLLRDGAPSCPVQVSWVALLNAHGKLEQSVGFLRDLTVQRAATQRIEELAYSDALTGLPNRAMLAQRFEFALHIAKRDSASFAIMFLDLDRFKNINDSLGHQFGDEVLVKVAHRIQTCLRQVDTLCRVGGDEFVLFLHNASISAAEMVARRVLAEMAEPFALEDIGFSVNCSMGIAMFPQDGETLDDLIRHADTAMYRVKERGRGSFGFYQADMNVNLLARMKMEHSMRQAMAQGRFRLHYQPQLSLHTGHVLGVEALIRWTDPVLGPISPGVFIPLAEESGYIVTLGSWVLEEAVRQAARWHAAGMAVTVSVNVSALQFRQRDFVGEVANVLADTGLAPHLLELELTESILIHDAQEVLERLRALAELGVCLSIDDFGTGYSSLAYLKRFPIHKLKIDQSFVRGLPADEGDKAIVSAIVSMGHALKLKVIAEGVETEAQRHFLQQLQCDDFQGFLCSPAVSPADFELLLEKLTLDAPAAL